MPTSDTYIVLDGNAFYLIDGVLFAAPIALNDAPDWDNACEVDDNSDTPRVTLDGIRNVLVAFAVV